LQVKFNSLQKLIFAGIKQKRLKAGLTQEKLAEKAGLNYKFYQRVESGKSNLTLKTLSKISRVLKIHPREFFD